MFQLDVFWRRALFADNNKVHCLVNADLLDYDVSDKGEKSLEKYMKNAEAKGIILSIVEEFFHTCIFLLQTNRNFNAMLTTYQIAPILCVYL